jgi:hypothetical protein
MNATAMIEFEKFFKLVDTAGDLIIGPTDGSETIALACDTFPEWIDPEFEKAGTSVSSLPMPEVAVQVLDLIQDGTFLEIFDPIKSELDCLCLTQTQVISFANRHYRWISQKGYGTFFFFSVSSRLYSIRVGRRGGRKGVYLEPLTYDYKWSHDCGLRIVIPQW